MTPQRQRRGLWGRGRRRGAAGASRLSRARLQARERVVVPLASRYLAFRERRESGVAWNPLDHGFHQDPVPTYHALRERDPVHRSRLTGAWVLTRFDDIDAALRDHETYSSALANSPAARQARDRGAPVPEPSILVMDPPDHTRLRALVAPAFTRRAIDAWRPRIEARVDELLDRIQADGRADVMEALAAPLPVMVIAEMLGVPPEDYAWFKERSDIVARQLEPTSRVDEGARAFAARDELSAYLGAMVEDRRLDPREDLISRLIAVEEQGDRLDRQELVIMLRLLLVAGNETTTNLIGNGLLALIRHPDEWEWLRQHPDEVEAAVEELVRFDSPVQTDARVAMKGVELRGKTIEPGQQLFLLLGAANRDPERFREPDRLDLSRGDKNHLAFGRGIHHCLGAPLARLEAQVAFRALADRFGAIRLAGEAEFKDHVVLRGLKALPVQVR